MCVRSRTGCVPELTMQVARAYNPLGTTGMASATVAHPQSSVSGLGVRT